MYAIRSYYEASYLDIETHFEDFDDYWNPFFGGQGPAPGFLRSLDKELQDQLKDRIRKRINVEPDGSFRLIARAIVVKGIKNGTRQAADAIRK